MLYSPTIKVGDLVYHLIHGKTWVAIVLDLSEVREKCNPNKLCREYVLVHMQSGTEYESFFKLARDQNRISDSSGLVGYHWLRRITEDYDFF